MPRNFLLYLKALIWSVFVSYTPSTVSTITKSLREGVVSDDYPEFKDSHLGDSLRFFIKTLPTEKDRLLLASCLEQVKGGKPSMIYQNMVIEVGHYVTAKEAIHDIPADCPGVVYCLKDRISVLFKKKDGSLSAQTVHPFDVMPVYTLTIPDA